MARVSALAMQAERAAEVLRESIATRSALRDQVEQGENLLRMRHESAVAYERAAHTALRQLDEAETAAARAAERAAALLAAADDVEIASDPRSATERCVELEEGAARVLLEMGERVARAHEDGLFAAAVRVGQAGATSGDGFETGGEEVSKIKAAVLASADAVVAALHAVRTRAGAAAAAERPNASAALERASADDDDDDESPVYPAALAHAPWIEVNTRSWAVLLPAQADAGGSDRDSEPDDADDAAADGGARARSGGAGAQERGDEGGGEEEEEGGAGGPALRAMPIEALSRQHAALSSRLVEMRAAARSLEVRTRRASIGKLVPLALVHSRAPRLAARHLPTDPPALRPRLPPPRSGGGARDVASEPVRDDRRGPRRTHHDRGRAAARVRLGRAAGRPRARVQRRGAALARRARPDGLARF
jgi:hypothetical protein